MSAVLPPLKEAESTIGRIFMDIVRAIVARIGIKSLERWISQGRVDVVARSGLSEATLSPLTEAIRAAYASGGTEGAAQLARVRFVFNMRNPAAEAWLREHSSRLVTNILTEQMESIRATVAQGTALGRNPRQTALDIAGRIDRQTGRRAGGIVGLSEPQARYVANARAQLLSGDKGMLRAYLTRDRRDRRYDAIVRRAIESGKPIPAGQVDVIVGRYADRLLKARAEVIARTEAMAAFNTARDESFRQAIEAGDIEADSVTKTWKSAADSRVRDSHRTLNGQRQPMSGVFQSPTGARLRYPGDSLNAGAADTANCRCQLSYKVDFLRGALRGN